MRNRSIRQRKLRSAESEGQHRGKSVDLNGKARLPERLGRAPRPPSTKYAINALHEAGKSMNAIRRELGISHGAVWNHLNTPTADELMQELATKGDDGR